MDHGLGKNQRVALRNGRRFGNYSLGQVLGKQNGLAALFPSVLKAR